jgi:hypothetical protein
MEALPKESGTRKGKGKEKAQDGYDNDDVNEPVEAQVEAAFPRQSGMGKGKEKAQDDNDDVNDPSYQDTHDLSALYIIQQASSHSRCSPRSIMLIGENLLRHGRRPHTQIVPSSFSSLEITNSSAFAIDVLKLCTYRIPLSRTLVKSLHTENSMLAYIWQQFRTPSIGKDSVLLALGKVLTAVVRVVILAVVRAAVVRAVVALAVVVRAVVVRAVVVRAVLLPVVQAMEVIGCQKRTVAQGAVVV